MLDWTVIVPSNSPLHTRKGVELSRAFAPGYHLRFVIYEIRTLEADGYPGITFCVRDADTVTDAQSKEGIRPKVVFMSGDLKECISFCKKNEISY